MLLHSTAQLMLNDSSQAVWGQELSYAKSCLDVLEYCGEVDLVARRFAEKISGFYNALKVHAQEGDLPAVDMPEKFDYPFTIPESATGHIGSASRELLKLISSPFGHESNLNVEGTLRAGFGSQQDWNAFIKLPFNRTQSANVGNLPILGMALSGLRSGQFVGSSQPHGWDLLPHPN
jgi:hypothetical protein